MTKTRDILLLVLIGLITISLRLRWIFITGFNGLYGQDPYAYFDFAIELQHAVLTLRQPAPFFWPLGYPALLLLAFGIFGASAAVGQALSVLLGSALPLLIYMMCRQLDISRSGAFVAAICMAVCGQAVQSSIVIMSDIPALFWATLSAASLMAYQRNNKSPFLVVAAGLLTFAGITRWLYFSLAPLWAFVVLLHWRGKIRWRISFTALGIVLCVLVPQIAYSWNNPFPSLNHEWVTNWSVTNMVTKTFSNVEGYFSFQYSNMRFYAAPFLNPYYVSPVFLCFLVIGLGYLIKKHDIMSLILLVGWMLIPFLFLAGIPAQNIRFPLIMMPPIVLLVGVGVDYVLHMPGRFHKLSSGLLGFVCLVGMVHGLRTSEAIIHDFIARQQDSKAIAGWIQTQIPPDATLYTFEVTLILQHETPFTLYDLYYETPESLAEKWQDGQADYALVNVWTINHQWEGKAPYTAFYWLIQTRGYTTIGRYGNFTLFQLGS